MKARKEKRVTFAPAPEIADMTLYIAATLSKKFKRSAGPTAYFDLIVNGV
jgi:hypothetical protein